MYLIDKLEFVNEDYLYNRRLLVLYLKALSLSDGQDIYNMLQEIEQNDNGFHNKVYGMTFSQFKIWLANEFAVDNGNKTIVYMNGHKCLRFTYSRYKEWKT